jgi:hypothetical protein
MPTLRFESSLAAATSLANLLQGSKFENLPFPASVSVFAVQDGADAGDVTLDLTMGNSIDIDGAAVPTFTANQGPNRSDHHLGTGVANAFDRVQIKLTNADAVNASAYRILVEFRRLG